MIETKVFRGKLDSDSDLISIAEHDMVAAENVSYAIARDGKIASAKFIRGNRQVSGPVPTGAVCVGTCRDEGMQRIYYFLYDPAGQHRIVAFSHIPTAQETLVLQGPELNLSSSFLQARIVGDILYWTQPDRQPKRINVERSIAASNPGYVPASKDKSPMEYSREHEIMVARPMPLLPPTLIKAISTESPEIEDQVYNFLDNNAFQFSYRFLYKDGEISAQSPWSKIANYNKEDQTFDTIVVTIPTAQYIPKEVSNVQLLVSRANIGPFVITKVWDRSNGDIDAHNTGAPLVHNFFNDRNGVAVSDEESAKPFDNVPILSSAMEVARNRLFLGNNLYGRDLYRDGAIDVALSQGGDTGTEVYATYVAAVVGCGPDEDPFNPGKPLVPQYETGRVYVRVEGLSPALDGYYNAESVGTYFDFLNGILPPVVTLTPALKLFSLAEGDMDTELEENVRTLSFCYDAIGEYYYQFDIYRNYPNALPAGGDVIVNGLSGATSLDATTPYFKSSSKYRLGIVFYDHAGRNAGVYSPENAVIKTPDRTYASAAPSPAITATLTFSPDQIPDWAEYYQVVRTKNLSYQRFIQVYGTDIRYAKKKDDGTYDTGTTSTVPEETFDPELVDAIAISLTPVSSAGMGYSYQQGDVAKIYFADGRTFTLRVITTQGAYAICSPVDMDLLTISGKPHVLELGSPYRSFIDETFYEVGVGGRILNPGTATRTLSNTTVVMNGDISLILRPVGGGSALMEAMNPNDTYWDEWLTDAGRPNIEIQTGATRLNTAISYSAVFIPGSEINGMSSFESLDQVNIDNTIGPIASLVLTNRTQEYGSVMLAIGSEETASLYLGETRIVDNAGASIIATSGSVIGTINPLKGGYGTENPESVVSDDGDVYYVDARKGCVVMYSSNGLRSISDDGMANFFRTSLVYAHRNGIKLPAGVDRWTGQYILRVPDFGNMELLTDYELTAKRHVITGGKCYAYRKEYGWTQSITMYPERLDSLESAFVTFLDGQLWLHDGPSNSFYGIVSHSSVTFVIGQADPFAAKNLNYVMIDANRAPDWVHMFTDEEFEQSTDLVSSEFSIHDGIYHAKVLMDRNSPGFNGPEDALLFGTPVTGRMFYLTVEYYPNNGTMELESIHVDHVRSRGHIWSAK